MLYKTLTLLCISVVLKLLWWKKCRRSHWHRKNLCLFFRKITSVNDKKEW